MIYRRFRLWYCILFHRGAINWMHGQYQCPQCLRMVKSVVE
jgi:hypothetical protein